MSAQLAAVPTLEPPYADTRGTRLRLVRDRYTGPPERFRGAPPDLTDDLFAPAPTPRSALSDPHAHVARLVQATAEVLAGRRSLQQLMPHLTERAYARLTARLLELAGTQRFTPIVRFVRVCEPQDGSAEASVVVKGGDGRFHAVAVRIDGEDGRWMCSVLDIL